MITIYLTYARPMNVYDANEFGRVIPAGTERVIWTTNDPENAAMVAASWINDPDTISVRTVTEVQISV